jgi:hypothetical protein
MRSLAGELQESSGTVPQLYCLVGSQRSDTPRRYFAKVIGVKANRGDKRIDTTLEELIAAVSEGVFEYSTDPQKLMISPVWFWSSCSKALHQKAK